jgi:hypothetical protein
MSLNVSEQECNGGKKYGQKGTLCGPNSDIKAIWLYLLLSFNIIQRHIPFP